MKSLTNIRFCTYIILLAAAALRSPSVLGIPLHLLDSESVDVLEAEADRRKSDEIIVSSAGFQQTTLSGSEVAALAKQTATKHSVDLKRYREPEAALRRSNGRLVWIVFFWMIGGPSSFEVRIDDEAATAIFDDTPGPY
jgi:hypothetical protein